MTSERISASLAPSVAPAKTAKTTTAAGGEDFAATLTQARGSSGARETTPNAGVAKQESIDAAKATSGAAPEAAAGAADTEQESAETTVATKGVRNPRASRDSKSAAAAASGEGVVPSALPLPTDPTGVLNLASPLAPLPPAVGNASQESDVVAESATTTAASSAEAAAAVLAGRSAASDAVISVPREQRASPPGAEATALVTTVVTQNTAAAAPVAAQSLPVESLITASGADVRPSTAPTADQIALTIVTNALQATASTASEVGDDVTSDANAPTEALSEASSTLLPFTSSVGGSDAATTTRVAQGTAQYVLHTPVGTRGWSDELATRLTLMLDQRQQSATLRLSPENLGPLEVHIDVREGQVSVWFGAAQADTRAAIESALPRLRELLQDQGLSLADAGVFQQSHRDSSKHHSPSAPFSEPEGANEMSVSLRVGLFDGYA